MKLIGLFDENELYRSLTKHYLDSSNKYLVVIEGNGQDILTSISVADPKPEIILTDFHLKEINGYDLIHLIKKNFPQIKVMIFSQFDHQHAVHTAMKKGANGFISKKSDLNLFLLAIESLTDQQFVYANSNTCDLLSLDNLPTEKKLPKLSSKQCIFLSLCSDPELSYKMIADKMGLSPKTVDRYRDLLFKKLNISSRAGLMIYALKIGLTDWI